MVNDIKEKEYIECYWCGSAVEIAIATQMITLHCQIVSIANKEFYEPNWIFRRKLKWSRRLIAEVSLVRLRGPRWNTIN